MQLLILMVLWIFFLLTSLAFTRIAGKVLWNVDLLTLAGNADLENASHIRYMRFLQVVNQVAVMILPPLGLALLISARPLKWLTLNRGISWISLVTGIMLILVALPAIDMMGQWNMSIRLPAAFSGIEAWMLQSEETATKLTEAFMSQTSPWQLFSNLMMVGVLAALGEELLFRVALIRILSSWLGKRKAAIHVAIFISAFFFAALHLQFFTFLPRFVLGLLLGYLFVWSGSIWLPFTVHLANNSFAVIAYYAFNTGISAYNPSELGSGNSSFVYILSFAGAGMMTAYLYFRGRNADKAEWIAELRGLDRLD